MSSGTEQLIRDYLNRLSVAARGQLSADDRRALVNRTRDFIEQRVGFPRQVMTTIEVAQLLSGLGDPSGLVRQERQRLADQRGETGEPVSQASRNWVTRTLRGAPDKARSRGSSWHWPVLEGNRSDLQASLLRGEPTTSGATGPARSASSQQRSGPGQRPSGGTRSSGATRPSGGSRASGRGQPPGGARSGSGGRTSGDGWTPAPGPAPGSAPSPRNQRQAASGGPAWPSRLASGRPTAAGQGAATSGGRPTATVPRQRSLPEAPDSQPGEGTAGPAGESHGGGRTDSDQKNAGAATNGPASTLAFAVGPVPSDDLPGTSTPEPPWWTPAGQSARRNRASGSAGSNRSAGQDAPSRRDAPGHGTVLTKWAASRAGMTLARFARWCRRHPVQAIAILFLGIGGALFPPFWLIGAVMAVSSRRWDALDKWLGLGLPVFLTVLAAVIGTTMAGHSGIGHDVHLGWVCADIFSRLTAFLGACYLAWRCTRQRRSPHTPPWHRPGNAA